MMVIGIDGNMWYCSNGLCLGDPKANFTFERTLGEAVDAFRTEFQCFDEVPESLVKWLNSTPEEYKRDQEKHRYWLCVGIEGE